MFLDFDKAVQFNPNSSSDITLVATTNADSTNEDSHQFNAEDSRLSIQGKKLTLLLTNILLTETKYTFTLPQDFLLEDNDIGNKKLSLTFTTARITLDISLLSINTTNWYEAEDSTDDGSFNQVITLMYPTLSYAVSNNDSLTGFFDTDLTNQIGTPTSPVTISNLPNGLTLRISKQPNGSQLRLTGNATSHKRRTDNTSFSLTLHDDFFDVDTSDNIHFDFDVIFGTAYWQQRITHQALAYDDKLWILGGQIGQNNSINNMFWYRDNTVSDWHQIAINNNPWSFDIERHEAVFYNNKLWILGGNGGNSLFKNNDIWTSADKGTNWNKINVTGSHWSARAHAQAFTYDDKLWVLGGGGISDEIWASDITGSNWHEITVTGSHWSPRSRHQAFAYDDKLWVLGGSVTTSASKTTNDIWFSADSGTNWSQVVVSEDQWDTRYNYQAFAYDDKLWVLGGITFGNGGQRQNDIWSSTNGGTNWSEVEVTDSHWSARSGFQALAYDNKLWVLGGNSSDGFQNDVWTSDDGGVTWEEIIPEGSFY